LCSTVANRCFPKDAIEVVENGANNETIGEEELRDGYKFVTYCDIIWRTVLIN